MSAIGGRPFAVASIIPGSSSPLAADNVIEINSNGLGELRRVARLAADMRDTHAGNGFGHAVSGKEPGLQLIELPVAAQQREQVRGEHHQAIALAFALADLDDQRWVSSLHGGDRFGDPQTCIEGGEDRAMFQVAWGQQ